MHAACASENLQGTTQFRTQEHSEQSSGWICRVVTLSIRVYWVTGSLVSQRHTTVYLVTNNKLHTRFSPFGPSSGSVSNYKRDDDIVNILCVHCMWEHPFFYILLKLFSKTLNCCSLVYWSCVCVCVCVCFFLRFTVADILKCIQCFSTLMYIVASSWAT